MALLYDKKTKRKLSGRIAIVLVIVKLSGTPGCLTWLPKISAFYTIR